MNKEEWKQHLQEQMDETTKQIELTKTEMFKVRDIASDFVAKRDWDFATHMVNQKLLLENRGLILGLYFLLYQFEMNGLDDNGVY